MVIKTSAAGNTSCCACFLLLLLLFSCCCCRCGYYSCRHARMSAAGCRRGCRKSWLFIYFEKRNRKRFHEKKGNFEKMSFTNLNVFFFARCYCCCFYSYPLSSLLGVSDEEELPGARGERNKRSANSLLIFFLKKKTNSQQKKPSSRRTRTENCSTPTSSSSRGRSWGPGG